MINRRIGIYSGTFDPVHAGHIAFAESARVHCNLDAIFFIPEQAPRFKQNSTDFNHRLAMLEQATAAYKYLHVAQLTTPRFTVPSTLPEIQQRFHGADLTLLIGSDVVQTLSKWEGISTLLQHVTLAVGLRATDEPRQISSAMSHIGVEPNAYQLITVAEKAHASSSAVRGGDVSHIVPSTMLYIQQNNLYI